ncbi:MAG TPA: DUF2203 domain-containing protein [Candidatus Binataceae bacterium]|nr:DUF2203 domain-containing protein [Candidatus Binataceae bacterium]
MSKHRFEKLFSADEANQLIPRLEAIIRDLQVQAGAIRKRIADLARFDDKLADLDLPKVITRYPELRPIATRMSELAGEIQEMGCFLKDIDQGLVDFPFVIDTEDDDEEDVAFLCWQYGEPRIVAWHSVEGGFGQRRPLPGVDKPLLN